MLERRGASPATTQTRWVPQDADEPQPPAWGPPGLQHLNYPVESIGYAAEAAGSLPRPAAPLDALLTDQDARAGAS